MIFIKALIACAFPVFTLFFPGLFIFKQPRSINGLFSHHSKSFIFNTSFLLLLTLLLTLLKLPVWFFLITSLLTTALFLFTNRKEIINYKTLFLQASFLTLFLLAYLLFSFPFLSYHVGMPTGDSQKSIYWADNILANTSLPNYKSSLEKLNRDPVDFFTPGLHTATAYLMSPYRSSDIRFMTIGFYSIAACLAIATVCINLAKEIIPAPHRFLSLLLTPLFLLSNPAFLRYLREPGYHYQNIIGELLTFGLLLLAIQVFTRLNRTNLFLFVISCLALISAHQFSSFITIFILSPPLLILVASRRKHILKLIQQNKLFSFSVAIFLVMSATFLFSLNLHDKIPHLFNLNPHLKNLTPGPDKYFHVFGAAWFISGVFGLILLSLPLFRKTRLPRLAFIISTFTLLLLSQGPRLYIDIPPVRAAYYLIVPLSITGAYFFSFLLNKTGLLKRKFFLRISLAAIIIHLSCSGLAQAYNLSHQVRTNSTLIPEYINAINYLNQFSEGAVLIDDYNRRSASWLMLSGLNTYSRISADLKRQMQEASQSDTRYSLYLKQLDYEKIFSLGSKPISKYLLDKHSINWITGIDNSSSTSLEFNPALIKTIEANTVNLYHVKKQVDQSLNQKNKISNWLLKTSTLVNDIGDREDTYKHLPASLRTTRLSDPIIKDDLTYRTSSAPIIPLYFNINDYVSLLWNKEGTSQPDTSVELYISAPNNSSYPLTVSTPNNNEYVLTSEKPTVKIPPAHVPINNQGFIVINILNPQQLPVSLDLIALGLAKTP